MSNVFKLGEKVEALFPQDGWKPVTILSFESGDVQRVRVATGFGWAVVPFSSVRRPLR